MIGSPSISYLALPPLKLRDKDPVRELFSIDLAEVSPSSSVVNHVQKQSQ
jgi:hypothetical protein